MERGRLCIADCELFDLEKLYEIVGSSYDLRKTVKSSVLVRPELGDDQRSLLQRQDLSVCQFPDVGS